MRRNIVLGKLPDPFVKEDGKRVENVKDWEVRRKEILDKTIGLEYGGMPPKPDRIRLEVLNEWGSSLANAYRVHCYIKEKDFTFTFLTYRPEKEGRCPVILTGDVIFNHCCNDAVIAEANRRGFVVVKFNRTEMAPDTYTMDRSDGIYPIWPELGFSAISAWAWGYHRVVDALFKLPYIDTNHIAITGHSRGGKTVLLAGATDERVRYVNPNNSGAHGCGCYRYDQYDDEHIYNDHRNEKHQKELRRTGSAEGHQLRRGQRRGGEHHRTIGIRQVDAAEVRHLPRDDRRRRDKIHGRDRGAHR